MCCLPLRCCFKSSNFSVCTLHTCMPRTAFQHAQTRVKQPNCLAQQEACTQLRLQQVLRKTFCNKLLALVSDSSKSSWQYLAIVSILLWMWGPFPWGCSGKSRETLLLIARVSRQPDTRIAAWHGDTHHWVLGRSPRVQAWARVLAHGGIHSILERQPALCWVLGRVRDCSWPPTEAWMTSCRQCSQWWDRGGSS